MHGFPSRLDEGGVMVHASHESVALDVFWPVPKDDPCERFVVSARTVEGAEE